MHFARRPTLAPLAWALLSASALVAACGGEPAPTPPPPPPAAEPPPPAPVAEPPAPPAPPLPPVDLVAGTPSPRPDKAPQITIKAPVNQQKILYDKGGDFTVKLELKGWDVPGDGNHVHLILDNRPYKRIDNVKEPIKLKDIDPEYAVGEGQHVLVAFPSRPTHESVKPVGGKAPLAVVAFSVGKGEEKWKASDPTLVYSRPKGENKGPPPADGLLVDFYLANAELGEGKYSVEATLKGPGVEAGKKVVIKEWRPYRIKNPRDGRYSLHLALLDKDGKPVPGAWNDTTREFTVDAKAPADGGHGGHAEPPKADGATKDGPPGATPPKAEGPAK